MELIRIHYVINVMLLICFIVTLRLAFGKPRRVQRITCACLNVYTVLALTVMNLN